MRISQKQLRRIGLGSLVIALGGLTIGADAPPQTIDAGGLTFQVPATWKSSPPSNAMRRAELKVAPAEGDSEPAELVVTAFPGGAGTVPANLERWQKQFRDDDGNPPRIETKEITLKGAKVTRAETAGRYSAMQFPGQPKQPERSKYRLLGAIVQTDKADYYLKMVGPDRTMVAARPDFDRLIASISAATP